MTVDFVASEVQFAHHLAPVWHAVPDELRGSFWCGLGMTGTERTLRWLRDQGIRARVGNGPRRAKLCVVVSVMDMAKVLERNRASRLVFGEHGCGITYNLDRQSSYVGSPDRDGCVAITTPNDHTAATQAAATPDIEVVSLGSEPRLDRWVGYRRARSDPPTVAVSFHSDLNKVCPEARNALPYYRQHLGALVDAGYRVLGHGHPRLWTRGIAPALWRKVGFELCPDFDQVLAEADVFCVDNSSTLFEAAAAGIPTVAMNCPRYRRHVNHGLRFWDHIPGVECEDGPGLVDAVKLALDDPPWAREKREAAVSHVFPRNDGHAADRFAEVIARWADELVFPDEMPERRKRWAVHVDGAQVGKPYRVEAEARRAARKRGDAATVVRC